MKKQAQDFAVCPIRSYQSMMERHELYRVETCGERIYGLDGEFINIVFATDAFGLPCRRSILRKHKRVQLPAVVLILQ